jgi:phosphatidylethanolamine-binding protein (PEBP) family uncharacterized protein
LSSADLEYATAAAGQGNTLTEAETQRPPARVNWPHEDGKLYTLYLGDLDAPSREKAGGLEWIHWLVCNIPGNDIAAGDTLLEYAGPTPPRGSGPHRYYLKVYEQAERLNPLDADPGSRAKFDSKRFFSRYAAKLTAENWFVVVG